MSSPPPGPDLTNEGLFSKIYCENGIRYVCGYRSICVATNDENIDKVIAARIHSDTLMIRVDASRACPPNIEILCEELVFVSGAKYSWPEKSVSIRCLSISLISDNDNKPVEFDLSGWNGERPASKPVMVLSDEEKAATKAKAPGLTVEQRENIVNGWGVVISHKWFAAKYDESKAPVVAQQGRAGMKGAAGERGQNSGSFQLFAEELDHSVTKAGIAFALFCNGGAGGIGQDGQNGAQGGAGLDHSCEIPERYESNSRDGNIWQQLFSEPVHPPDVHNNLLHIFRGAAGGLGGNGGPGGKGGNSGNINISPKSLEKAFNITQNVGQAGLAGTDGTTGDWGVHSTSNVFKTSPFSSWSKYADDHLGGSEKTKDKDLAKEIDAWATNNKEPETKAQVSITHLSGDALWALYEASRPTEQGTKRIESRLNSELHQEYTMEASFLQKIVDRLRFEHFVHTTCQPYASNASLTGETPPPSKAQLRLKASMNWMTQVFNDIGPNDQRPLIKSVLLSYAALSQSYYAPIAADAFDNSIWRIPWIPSASTFEKTLTDFETIEKWYSESAALLASQGAQRDALQRKIDGAKALVALSAKEIQHQDQSMATLAKTFEAAAENVSEAREQLEGSVRALRDEIDKHVECKLDAVLEALSSALMFTNAENPAALAGAALSIGLGMTKTANEMFGQVAGVDKTLLYSKVDVMTKANKELKAEIAKTVTANDDLIIKEGELRAQIVVDRSKFDSMVDQYLTEIPGATAEVKKRFNLLIKAIDRKNKILSDYNNAALGIAKACQDTHEQHTLIDSLGSSKSALNDDEVQFVALFMGRAYEDMGRFAVRTLYSRVRAFNCVSFSRSHAFDSLALLNSWSAVTAATLQIAVKSALQSDFYNVQANWARTKSCSKSVTIIFREADYPIRFDELRKKWQIMFDIDWDMLRPHFGDDDAWDIRLLAISVYLPGAKVNRSKLAPDPTPSQTMVNLHISNTGVFRFRDQNGKTHSFELLPSRTPFVHKEIAAENAPESDYVPATGMVKGESYELDFLDGKHDPIPLQSPLGAWIVAPVKDVDLTNCKSLRFDFQVSYRV